jgi:hypothetical protein
MKKFLVLPFAAFFVLAACKTDDYPPFVYTNMSPYDISFKTAEKDSPEYQLKKIDGKNADSMTLDSDVRGRAEIDGGSLKPVYTDWRQAGDDVYSIEFFERTSIPVKISNNTAEEITLSEKKGYLKLEAEGLKVAAGATDVDAVIYTKTPSFEISGNTYPAAVSFNIVGDEEKGYTMYVLISLP